MPWTAPMTWAGNTVLTAAQLNTHLMDNMLELAPALAITESSYFMSDGPNSLIERMAETDRVFTSETTVSTAFADLATVGPQVTVTTDTTALVFHHCRLENNTTGSGAVASWAISGATTRAALNSTAVVFEGTANNYARLGDVDLMTGLTAGSNTFTMKYRVGANTGTFTDRFIAVMPL